MIAIFKTKDEAQKYSDKIHEFLRLKCPNYNAALWQNPVSNKLGTEFYIQIPQEYEKQYYKDSLTIIAFTKKEYDTKTKTEVKPDDSFSVAVSELPKAEEEIIK